MDHQTARRLRPVFAVLLGLGLLALLLGPARADRPWTRCRGGKAPGDKATTKELGGDVETSGEITTGMTVFDRRRLPAWRHNMEVALDMQADKVIEAIVAGVKAAAQAAG